MKQIIITISILFILLGAIAGCGSDKGEAPLASSLDSSVGPISFDLVETRLLADASDEDLSLSDADLSLSGKSSASIATKVASGVITHFIPEAAPAIGLINSVKGFISGNKTAEQINQLTQDVQTEQTEIAGIENTLNLQENEIYNNYLQNQENNAETWAYNFYQIIQYFRNFTTTDTEGNPIITGNSYYDSFIGALDLNSDGSWPSTITYETVAANSAKMSSLNTLVAHATFLSDVNELSTTEPAVGCQECYDELSKMTTGSSATMGLYNALLKELEASIPMPGTAMTELSNCPENPKGSASTGFACYLDKYNEAIMAIYQQTVAGLQQAYTMEATINYLNYVNGLNNGGSDQIEILSGIDSVTYQYPAAQPATKTTPAVSEQQAFENIQLALAKLYAARINQLYLTTLSYIVSDQPIINSNFAVQNATWTPSQLQTTASAGDENTANIINKHIESNPYSSFISFTKATSTLSNSATTPPTTIPTVTTNDYMFYQYFGLSQIYTSIYNVALIEQGLLDGATELDSTTCPPLFPQSNTATWDGINMDVYYGYNGSNPTTASEPLLTSQIDAPSLVRDNSYDFILYTQDLTTRRVWALIPWSINPSNPIYVGPHDLSGTGNIYFDFEPVKHHYLQITYDIINTYLSSSPPQGDLITVNSDGGSGVVQTVDAKESHYSNLMFYILNQYNTTTSQSDDDAFVGAFYVVGINNGSGNWNIYLTCPTENPTFCTIEDNGICSGGRTLQLSGSHDCTGKNWCVDVVAGSNGSCQN